MKSGDTLFKQKVKLNQDLIELSQIYPVGKIIIQGLDDQELTLTNAYEGKFFENIEYDKVVKENKIELVLNGRTLQTILLSVEETKEVEVEVLLGNGLYVERQDEAFTNLLHRKQGWVGSDGIFSINLTGNDSPFAKDPTTLLCFGDTFVGTVDPVTHDRTKPHLMLNNTFALLKGKEAKPENIQFLINQNNQKQFISYVSPETNYSKLGSFASNLTHENYRDDLEGWLSTYAPQSIELDFDLNKIYDLSEVTIYNYFKEGNVGYRNRGLRAVQIQYSTDQNTWLDLNDGQFITIEKAHALDDITSIAFNVKTRYIKLIGIPVVGSGNYGGLDGNEALFGLRKVLFITKEGQSLLNVRAKANTEFYTKRVKNWYWMQDGVRIVNHLYYLPLIVSEDLTAPEGYQFSTDSVTMLKIPLDNNQPQFQLAEQKDTSLFYKKDGVEIPFGAAILFNSKENNPISGDDYIYVYGYRPSGDGSYRNLLVARVLPEDFENIDEWRFYNGENWVTNLLDAKDLVGHVSCEMSVTPIYEGPNKGKYVAVYTYNVNTNYVAYSIADTPYGPFGAVNKVYYCQESQEDHRIYTYNAKAHPHLSEPNSLLVTYNTNTFSDELNASNGNVYRPRFIRLVHTNE